MPEAASNRNRYIAPAVYTLTGMLAVTLASGCRAIPENPGQSASGPGPGNIPQCLAEDIPLPDYVPPTNPPLIDGDKVAANTVPTKLKARLAAASVEVLSPEYEGTGAIIRYNGAYWVITAGHMATDTANITDFSIIDLPGDPAGKTHTPDAGCIEYALDGVVTPVDGQTQNTNPNVRAVDDIMWLHIPSTDKVPAWLTLATTEPVRTEVDYWLGYPALNDEQTVLSSACTNVLSRTKANGAVCLMGDPKRNLHGASGAAITDKNAQVVGVWDGYLDVTQAFWQFINATPGRTPDIPIYYTALPVLKATLDAAQKLIPRSNQSAPATH